jgi:hypothetical protein
VKGFMTYSDRMSLVYPGYVLNDRLAVRPGPRTPVHSLKYVKDLLLSTDLSRNEEFGWMNAIKNYRFLDSTDLGTDSTCFLSVIRMGNSFLRSFIEDVTGVYTGSDMNTDLTLHIQQAGLAGESTTCDDNLVWITKTHWPADSPLGALKHSAKKAFCIVRNPID